MMIELIDITKAFKKWNELCADLRKSILALWRWPAKRPEASGLP